MTRYRKCSVKDLQNRLQFINRHLETLNSIKRELLEESEIRMELRIDSPIPSAPPVFPPEPPVLIRQIATRPPTPPPRPEVPDAKREEPDAKRAEPDAKREEPDAKREEPEGIAEPVLQFLETNEDNISLASNEINNIEQELKESLEKLSLAKMKKTLLRSKPKII